MMARAERFASSLALAALVFLLLASPWPLGSRRLWAGMGIAALLLGVGGVWLLVRSLAAGKPDTSGDFHWALLKTCPHLF